jgi:hypothetical protein
VQKGQEKGRKGFNSAIIFSGIVLLNPARKINTAKDLHTGRSQARPFTVLLHLGSSQEVGYW